MNSVFKNIRFYILFFSFLLSNFIYLYVILYFPSELIQNAKITQFYALTAFSFLYLALLAGPFCYTFKNIPFRSQYLKSRRALGVSAFYFAILHASSAFFLQLGGFTGLQFLSNRYLLPVALGTTSLLILSLLALTSFDKVIRIMSPNKWKYLHRFIYLASIFILIHALLLGSHFSNIYSLLPQIILFAIAFLLVIESLRLDNWLRQKFTQTQIGPTLTTTILGIFFIVISPVLFPEKNLSFNIHNTHQQFASQNSIIATMPGMSKALSGDKTKRFNVNFDSPSNILPSTETKLSFSILNASSGLEQNSFLKIYDKPMHLIITNEDLTYFEHIHPVQNKNIFTITTKFPENGKYHLYIDYQPTGAIEQQNAFTILAGDLSNKKPNRQIDLNLKKIIGNYEITLAHRNPLLASDINSGNALLTFDIKNKTTKLPVDLFPYLASYGHLVMINTQTFEYTHVHPTILANNNEKTNKKIEFMAMGLYSPIKPGIYKLFAQFNPDNKLILVEYILEIK